MIHQQIIRYVAVGLTLNATLYGAYLVLTQSLLGSRSAMTLTYCAGVLIGYLLNREITFRFSGPNGGPLLRYIGSYCVGYAVNLVALWFFVDEVGVAHQIVQAGAILTMPALLFALQKYWVFSDDSDLRPVRSAS